MSALKFHTKPSFNCPDDDLSDSAFVWASKSIGGRDAVEEFISCGVWPLAAGIDFEQVKIGETPISKLNVPLPRFPLRHEDDEDDIVFLVRVEQEARVIVGSYMGTEHEACIDSLRNNGRLNRVLEITRVAYGPCPAPVYAEVLKKRTADAAEKTLMKRLKAAEKKCAGVMKDATMPENKRKETAKVTVALEKRRTGTAKVTVVPEKRWRLRRSLWRRGKLVLSGRQTQILRRRNPRS
jgi:hypothetical protein